MILKILINSMEKNGGTERVTASLANHWIKQHDVEILVVSQSTKSFYDIHPNVRISSLNIGAYDKNPISISIWLIKIIWNLFRFLKKNPADVILGIWTSMSICSIIVGNFLKIRTVACEHIAYNFTRFPLRILRRIFYPFSSFVVTLTEKDRSIFLKYCKRVVCIENPLPFCTLEYPDPDYNSKKVLAIGRMVEQKGFDLLLLAWKEVQQIFPEWKLEIVGGTLGNDKYSQKLISIINRYHLTASVIFKPATKKIMDCYLHASVYVLSSRYEGLPMVLLEAMSIGLPVVSFDCPTGPNEIIEDKVSGILVPALDIHKLSLGLLKLIQSEDLRRQFGYTARYKIQERFKEENIHKKWDIVFKELMQ